MSVWFVTGASRGLGAEIVSAALGRGHRVVATARDAEVVLRTFPDKADSLLAASVDVTDQRQVQAAVEAAVERFGRIDVLVNNAGRGLLSAVEEASDQAARAVFDVNVFGVLNVQRAVLPTMRAQRSGHVLNMSSVGGFTTAPGWGLYAATKFALEGMSEALRAELEPLGIHVTIVEPGGFRTDFLDGSSLHVEPPVIADYVSTAGVTRDIVAANNHLQRGNPVRLAAAIIDLTETEKPPLRLQLGADSVARIEAKLEQVGRELHEWRAVAVATDHDDVPAT
ncbi:oxidoreductase [Actinopolymorpha pittospori]|uniref:NAD(P)-dependent dehydrogenase (Short-subunit alcohol dehydrogenase family) n=1 Tax=Actinopolymorpha pittospori TaxID=648752 RepID=A0A927RCD1_9ACTN|nr:oxidoreductase [Actinopolymorpha pittospori]MBE1609769.1 NAD(P)-dependent dehydrogenase (short-subunit alcohol dehydrogenase family) [Actinopolymorpha pittospori]